MGLIKKTDVKAYFAERRGLGIAAAEEASKRVRIGLSNAKPAGARRTSAEFLRDFSLEHSSQGASIPVVAGRSDRSRVPTVARNLQA
jgi:hypothetical protein